MPAPYFSVLAAFGGVHLLQPPGWTSSIDRSRSSCELAFGLLSSSLRRFFRGMNTIVTPHFTLEPLVVAHASEMFAVLSDPAIYEFENAPPETEEWLAKRYERLQMRGPDAGVETWLNWIVRLPDGACAGYVQATILPEFAAYIAYEFASRYWRRGIGSGAVGVMLRELRTRYQVREYIAVFKARNFRSAALLRKLGFVRASADQEARHRDEEDEHVVVKAASGNDAD